MENEELIEALTTQKKSISELYPYLPYLHKKFEDRIGRFTDSEKEVISYAFDNYKEYMLFVINNGKYNSNEKELSFLEICSRLDGINLHYKTIMEVIPSHLFLESDQKFLREIFMYYQDVIISSFYLKLEKKPEVVQ